MMEFLQAGNEICNSGTEWADPEEKMSLELYKKSYPIRLIKCGGQKEGVDCACHTLLNFVSVVNGEMSTSESQQPRRISLKGYKLMHYRYVCVTVYFQTL